MGEDSEKEIIDDDEDEDKGEVDDDEDEDDEMDCEEDIPDDLEVCAQISGYFLKTNDNDLKDIKGGVNTK